MTLSSNSSQTSSMLCKLYIQWSQPAPFRYLKAISNRTWLKQNSILLRAALPQYLPHFRKQFQYLPSCSGQKPGSHPNSPSPHDIHAFPKSVLTNSILKCINMTTFHQLHTPAFIQSLPWLLWQPPHPLPVSTLTPTVQPERFFPTARVASFICPE